VSRFPLQALVAVATALVLLVIPLVAGSAARVPVVQAHRTLGAGPFAENVILSSQAVAGRRP
jgi:hypothetical protein